MLESVVIVIINRKGFTLVELLAVIVIIGILTLLAIPSVTKYMNVSRQKLFAENAIRAVEAVKDYELKQNYLSGSEASVEPTCSKSSCVYNFDQINTLLDKKLVTSPFGGGYDKELSAITSGTVLVDGKSHHGYKMCLIDEGQNGFGFLFLEDINYKKVQVGVVTSCGYGATSVTASEVCYKKEGTVCVTDVQEAIDYLASLLQ